GVVRFGTDCNPAMVAWCVSHLSFAAFTVNDLRPPTIFEDDFFDGLYAISVLTHLTAESQAEWMREWARITRPGGLLLVTTSRGAGLPTDLAARLEAEGVLVNAPERN